MNRRMENKTPLSNIEQRMEQQLEPQNIEQGTRNVEVEVSAYGGSIQDLFTLNELKQDTAMEKKFDLEERLIDFAAAIIDITEVLPKTLAGNHLGSQLLRSGTSPALHYGEAQAAESPADFIHKMKVCLKELRETYNCLRLIRKKAWIKEGLESKVVESNELVAIFVASVKTAQANQQKGKRN